MLKLLKLTFLTIEVAAGDHKVGVYNYGYLPQTKDVHVAPFADIEFKGDPRAAVLLNGTTPDYFVGLHGFREREPGELLARGCELPSCAWAINSFSRDKASRQSVVSRDCRNRAPFTLKSVHHVFPRLKSATSVSPSP
jgi:hypothetical protein